MFKPQRPRSRLAAPTLSIDEIATTLAILAIASGLDVAVIAPMLEPRTHANAEYVEYNEDKLMGESWQTI
jgi:hypothetical protein